MQQGDERQPQGEQSQCNRGIRVNPPKTRQEQRENKSSSPKPSRVAARSAKEWEQERVRLEQRSQFPEELAELARLAAESNKSGAVATSRVVRELYEPILALEAKLSTEALAQGLQTAIARSCRTPPTCARSPRTRSDAAAAGTPPATPCGHSDYDRDFLTG